MGAGENGGRPRITVKIVRVRSKRFRAALALAESFGAPVFEPSSWPEDAGKVSYRLDGATYWIGSTRRGGTPVGVIGKAEKAELRLSERKLVADTGAGDDARSRQHDR